MQIISFVLSSMTLCDDMSLIREYPDGDGGEQGWKFVREICKDGDEADGSFYADGPDLVGISVSDDMKSCMRSFTDGEETISRFADGKESFHESARRHDVLDSNGDIVI
jgi:hypothetical protein